MDNPQDTILNPVFSICTLATTLHIHAADPTPAIAVELLTMPPLLPHTPRLVPRPHQRSKNIGIELCLQPARTSHSSRPGLTCAMRARLRTCSTVVGEQRWCGACADPAAPWPRTEDCRTWPRPGLPRLKKRDEKLEDGVDRSRYNWYMYVCQTIIFIIIVRCG